MFVSKKQPPLVQITEIEKYRIKKQSNASILLSMLEYKSNNPKQIFILKFLIYFDAIR